MPDVFRVDEISTPQDWPGHSLAITRMQEPPMFRTECECGWWIDVTNPKVAQAEARNHKYNVTGRKPHRPRKRREKATRPPNESLGGDRIIAI